MMESDHHAVRMARCLELAAKAGRAVFPNPLVGAVIELDGRIIAEGYHKFFGGPHAEVEAISAVPALSKLSNACLYVNLEPCAHAGKTPPCTSLIAESGIRSVVVGCRDPNPLVVGRGIDYLISKGVTVIEEVLEERCRLLNKRFFTYHLRKRPHVILKWAQSRDGYIAPKGDRFLWISNIASRRLVHQWRSEESAVMVGTNTALVDNPALTVREVPGVNPLRVVLDRRGRLPQDLKLFDESAPTLVFTEMPAKQAGKVEWVSVRFDQGLIEQILNEMYRKEILSVLIEGGAMLLGAFLASGLWDEARIFTAATELGTGVPAPQISGVSFDESYDTGDHLAMYYNPDSILNKS